MLGVFFPNMVMRHIKLKGMIDRTEQKRNCYPRLKLVTLGWDQRVKYFFFENVVIYDGAQSTSHSSYTQFCFNGFYKRMGLVCLNNYCLQ